MSRFSLRKLFGLSTPKAARRQAQAPRKLRLEALEDRAVPAVLFVDGTPGNAGADFTSTGGSQPALVAGVNPYPSISAAVAAASAGDTINVADGTYKELVNVNKSLTIQGNQFGVDARARGGAESVVSGNANGSTSFYVTASDVTIDGFTVQGQTNVNQFGAGIVLGAGTSGAQVLNNVVQDNVVGIFLANASGGGQAVISQNLIRNNNNPGAASGTGIYTDQSVAGGTVADVLIDNNTFVNNDTAALGFSSKSAAAPATGITISNNTFDDNGQALYAFSLTDSSFVKNVVQNSTASDGADLQLLEGVNGLTISRNVLQNGAGRVLYVTNSGTGLPDAAGVTFTLNSLSGYAGTDAFGVDAGQYTGTLDATNNYWGSATGPTTPANPGGTGIGISAPSGVVDFTPWLVSPVGTASQSVYRDAAGNTLVVNSTTGDYTVFLANGTAYSGTGARLQNGVLKIHDQSSNGKVDVKGSAAGQVSLDLRGKGKASFNLTLVPATETEPS